MIPLNPCSAWGTLYDYNFAGYLSQEISIFKYKIYILFIYKLLFIYILN
jgi:hypothetical protein